MTQPVDAAVPGDALSPSTTDQAALDALTAKLYAAFCNRDGRVPALDGLREVFAHSCIIAKAVGDTVEIIDLDRFIAQRHPLLTQGRLLDFAEWEIDARTWACGHVAGRCSLYAKAGVLDGRAFRTRGIKNLQFVKTPQGWRISALAWDDERPGLSLPGTL